MKNEWVTRNCDRGDAPTGVRSQWSGRTHSFFNRLSMTPENYCRKICKKSGSNFVYSFYLLPKKRREGLEAFYAFCRLIDDVVDQQKGVAEARGELTAWREELDRIYHGNPVDLVGKALAPIVLHFKIPKEYFQEIINGCEMDLTQGEYSSFEDLDRYLYRVASCVGLISIYLFEVPVDERNKEMAIAMGKALQMTNIVRDVVEDLSRGRVYLPQEDLKQFGVEIADLRGNEAKKMMLLDLLYFELDRAKQFFKTSWKLFPKNREERKKMIAAKAMGCIYERLHEKISRNPREIFKKKVRISFGEKLKVFTLILLKEYLA